MNALAAPSEGFPATSSPGALHHAAIADMGSAALPAPCLSRAGEVGSRGEGVALPVSVYCESPTDAAERDALLDRAMGPRWKRKSSHKLRRGRVPAHGLALVARDGAGGLAGTVRLWDVAVGERGGDGRTRPALLLGPLAVDPARKSAGIGTMLVRTAIAEARRRGHGAILLVGDPSYYQRFGFSADKTGCLAMPGPYERHRFLALELVAGALDGACGVLRAAGRMA